MDDKLVIDPPHELRFTGPFTRSVVTVLKLFNPTEHVMLFKIKTTAPKRYCVRPNFGTISPHEQTMVEICLQPFTYDANEKNKHKFMVQSLVVPENCEDFHSLWKEAEPDRLMDAKLKCVFEMPSRTGGDAGVPASNHEAQVADVSPKNIGEEKISNLQTSDQTDQLVSELKALRDDNSTLRKDNTQLKEQIIRLRVSQNKPPMDEPYARMSEPYAPVAEKEVPIFFIAISIAAAIFGLLLGKYLL